MLNVHSYYSLRYGIHSPENVIRWMKQNGYTTFALTDINCSTAILQFVRIAQEQGVKPVAGIDFREGIRQKYVGLAKNNRGFQELNHFLSQHLQNGQPFPDEAPALQHCFFIYPTTNLPRRKLSEQEYIGIGKSDLNKIKWSNYSGDTERMVILAPMTFLNKQDFNTHRLLRAIDKNTLLSMLPSSEQALESDTFQSIKELQLCFQEVPSIFERTQQLLDSCSLFFGFGEQVSPQNQLTYTGSEKQDLELITQLTQKGITQRYPKANDEIRKRVKNEIEVIYQKGFLSYFLITWDIIQYARSKGYFYVGRGSGANSIVAYLLHITNVDPSELDLYFERFINLYRKNPPDFDIDFSWKDRDDVIRYIFQRFPHSTLLATYSTFQYKATLRELGKVFGLPKSEIETLASDPGYVAQDKLSDLVLRYSKRIEGLPSHLSIHAGGIVIPEKPITWFSASFLPPKGLPTTQFSMLEAEDVGLFKFDILSQRGLSKISESLEIIQENQPQNPPHDIHDVHVFKNDEKIKALIRNAEAIGCFYVESPGMRMLLKKLQTDTYLGLVAASSIIRPGVAQSGMMREYILRHRIPEKRKEAHPVMAEIMPETYGVMVYQEDVIKVAHHFAGLTLAEADVLRRGMSGKFRSRSEFHEIRETFKENCLKRGYPEEIIREVWRQIESFAGYAFSKGHSASYAVESYQSLYLKAYYPLEYMLATINNFGGFYRTEFYVHEARKLGATIEPPSVNYGDYKSVISGKTIYLGFQLVSGIEIKVIDRLLFERTTNGPFTSFKDLTQRIQLPLEQLLLIIRIGGLRDFPESRKELLWKAHVYHNRKKGEQHQPLLFQSPVKDFTLPSLDEDRLEEAFEQLELLGFPLCSPFLLLKDKIPPLIPPFEQLHRKRGLKVCRYGYLVTTKRTRTTYGENMFFGTFIDQEGNYFDTVHFPEFARRYPFRGNGIYKITGIVTEEFGVYTIEVGQMIKLPYCDDPRYSEKETVLSGKRKNMDTFKFS